MNDNKMSLLRHIVAVSLVLGLQPPQMYQLYGGMAWATAIIFMLVVAGIISGIAWLFFTDKEKGKSSKSFITSLWFVSVVYLLQGWFGH